MADSHWALVSRAKDGQETALTEFCKKMHRKPRVRWIVDSLKAEFNPIRHLLALLGAHHIFHVSGLKVNTKQIRKTQ